MIEALVVAFIVGLVGAVAWFRLGYLAPRHHLERAALDLAAEIQKARGRAIAEQKCVRVSFDKPAKAYTVSTAPGDATCAGATFSAGRTAKLDDGGAINIDDGSGSAPVSAIFNPRGGSEATGGAYPTVRLSNDLGDARLVSVNSAGRVSLQAELGLPGCCWLGPGEHS